MISVIIPLYNGENTIIAALESVRRQSSAEESFEIIVIDDGSTDCSGEVVEKYMLQHPEMDIIIIRQENKGVSAARNAGLKRASGDYIALLDADDEWLPEKTVRQLKYLRNDDVDFLAARRNGLSINFPYKVKTHLAKITFQKQLIRNETHPSTVIFKARILQNTGYFDPEQRFAEDVQYWLRAVRNNKMFILDENLVIAGSGKRSFGVSGLSSNLYQMYLGYKKNLLDIYNFRWISLWEYVFYRIFYWFKYLVLLLRNFYYRLSS
ncbi:glycosyltransferase family 2 protein [Daejeonia sp. YH14]|uniref:glycosyltransferase family 2 protein n=1 Tax=Daejeonia sp. YH14 TaxID=3439042 RepID=UPI003F494CCB